MSRPRTIRHRTSRVPVNGRGLFTSLLGKSVIGWMGGKPVRKKKRHRNPIRRLKSWATSKVKSKAKSWIAKKVHRSLGIGGGSRRRVKYIRR